MATVTFLWYICEVLAGWYYRYCDAEARRFRHICVYTDSRCEALECRCWCSLWRLQ